MSLNRGLLFAFALSGLGVLVSACGPTYPKCDNDENCAEKGEFCLNGSCQQCRDNSHCDGPGMMCAAGKCQRQPGYCDDSTPCPGKQKCRDNLCGAECLDNSECAAGTICRIGACVPKPECGDGADTFACPDGQECLGGRCQAKLAQCGGQADKVYFDYNDSTVKKSERAKLQTLAECLKSSSSAPLTVVGHCDERGTEEYNMALGQRRADAARTFLINLGVSGGKVSVTSRGEEEPADAGHNEKAWRKNRRADYSDR